VADVLGAAAAVSPLRRRFLFAMPVLLVLTQLAAAGGARGGSAVSTVTFAPSDDAHVKSASATTNYGQDTSLVVRKATSNSHAYLKFAVTGLSGPASSAKLRLFVTDPSPKAGPIFTASNDAPGGGPWSESTVTWKTKPAIGATALSSLLVVSAGTWVEYDLGGAVAGNGTYSFALTGGSSDHAWFSSGEGANPPQLVVTEEGPPPPPTQPTADFSASPTSGPAPLTVQFTDRSTGSPTSWAWDFQGDGIVDSTAQNPTFTYAGAGTYTVALTATNTLGGDSETKIGYITVSSGNAPANTSPPTISPMAPERATAYARPGTWTGTAPITFSYQWQRCDAAGGSCADVDGATARSYALTPSDVGSTLRVVVTATNGGGATAASSATSSVVPERPTPPPGDPVIAAAGDIACTPTSSTSATTCRQRFTSDLLVNAGLTAVLLAGDIQYESGQYEHFLQSYDPTWGRVNGITYPAPGNHEYKTPGATGYFGYFGAVAGDPSKGYYSFDIGSWHMIALNSNCGSVGGCAAGNPQEQWLRADLAAHPAVCTLAYWHHPRFSSGSSHGNHTSMQPFWQALYDHGAEVVLSGHDHDYERFAPQTPTGAADPERGIREFVVGTGGKNLRSFGTPVANSQVRNSSTFGVLKLTLHPSGYDWQFVPEAGKTFTDSGSSACH
jgi:PKD repeat protein